MNTRTRYMRVLLFFDLPVETEMQRRNYRLFRKHLIKDGFIMLQNSVYAKMALNPSAAKMIRDRVDRVKPPVGIIQILIVTENQFASMEYILGQSDTTIVNSTDRLISL